VVSSVVPESSSAASSDSSVTFEEVSSNSSAAFSSDSSVDQSSSSDSSVASSEVSTESSASSDSSFNASSFPSEGGSSSAQSSAGNGGGSETFGGVSTPDTTGNSNGGAYRGKRTNTLGGVAEFLAGLILGKGNGDVAPGSYGGGPEVPFSTSEVKLICSMRRGMPTYTNKTIIQWVAAYLAPIMNRDADAIAAALRDPTFCGKKQTASNTVAIAQGATFPVDIAGYPVSSNATWNACVRGTVTLDLLRSNTDKDKDGVPRDCASYHTGSIWRQPDMNLYFGWNRSDKTIQLPSGYIIQQDIASL
jgi:hypothetical protein